MERSVEEIRARRLDAGVAEVAWALGRGCVLDRMLGQAASCCSRRT